MVVIPSGRAQQKMSPLSRSSGVMVLLVIPPGPSESRTPQHEDERKFHLKQIKKLWMWNYKLSKGLLSSTRKGEIACRQIRTRSAFCTGRHGNKRQRTISSLQQQQQSKGIEGRNFGNLSVQVEVTKKRRGGNRIARKEDVVPRT